MKLIRYCAVVVFSLLMYSNSFAQGEKGKSEKNVPANKTESIVAAPYLRTAPGCVSTLSPEFYTGRALEIPSGACEFQKKSIMLSQEEYKKSLSKNKLKK